MTHAKLNRELHIKYWQRCLNSLLPTGYTTTDSTRMSLGYFILSALDILSAPPLPSAQRTQIRNWILCCQHPSGGFCGSPNHKFPDAYYGDGKEEMDPANLPATLFALMSLGFVGRMEEVKRVKCLRWLKSLQRDDGSFGELVRQGRIEGGRDMRYCFVAVSVRWLLRGYIKIDSVEDIDIEALVAHIRAGQTFDGGVSESSQHEAHAGYTYCAIACLSLLGRLPHSSGAQTDSEISPGLTNISGTIRWLVSRQLQYHNEDDNSDDEGPGFEQSQNTGICANTEPPLESLLINENMFVGFNGRVNKRADTCYAFWVVASLSMIGEVELVDPEPMRRFLTELTQHQIGGFGKCPGNPPDIYHSYLGLAALATLGEADLKQFDATLCISVEQRQRLEILGEEALTSRNYTCFSREE
ncbi:terpenoid cyclases/protein prenyltransferase alpha-alpha toroid [Calycina marina]|uniref:Terpenoid cyclases/protein prenyltransferase alpha-alpha toroid n=1 Tax=Calycina marina TaxID=1763456 RepID=A0A9P8CIU5_9HELO|nr:terpenoid cyclases/protein prenyltransferase alpha-alpha toroid [Calycina marina]